MSAVATTSTTGSAGTATARLRLSPVPHVEARNGTCARDGRIWSQKYRAYWYQRGRITLSVSADRQTIITVLWASAHDWRADYARGGDLRGRERRTTDDMKHLPRRRA